MTRILTQKEAFEIFQNEEALYFPFKAINETGKKEIADILRRHQKGCAEFLDEDILNAYIKEAEFQLAEGNGAGIEIPATATHTGNPKAFDLGDDCWHWEICED